MAREATSSPTITPFTNNEIRDMLRQLKMKFDDEMKRTNIKPNVVLDLCKAMSTAAHMFHYKLDEE